MKYLALIIALLASPVWAKPPQVFTGVVTRISDGDTYIVKRDGDGTEVKVRLHYADCPEVAHKKGEVDQPDGQAALKAASELLLEKHVTVTVRGESYGRTVGDVVTVDNKFDAARSLLFSGHAMLDPRYHPPQGLVITQASAKAHRRGLWDCDTDPTPPWVWRAEHRKK